MDIYNKVLRLKDRKLKIMYDIHRILYNVLQYTLNCILPNLHSVYDYKTD